MKIKKLFAILCSIVVLCSVTVFAQEQNKTWIYTPQPEYVTKEVEVRNSTVTFTTRCESHIIDYRCFPMLDISIKENTAGILQDGDIIYFETSKYDDKYFKSWVYELKAQGVNIKNIELSEAEENKNRFAIRISRTNKKELAQIDMRFEADLNGISYKDETFPTFSLYLDADKTKENNLFAGEQNILLNDRYLTITDGITERNQMKNELHRKFKQELPTIVFFPETNSMTWNGEEIKLKHNVYINQKGSAMLSLEDLEYMINRAGGTVENMGDISNNNLDVYIVTAGKYSFNIDLYRKAVISPISKEKTMYDVLEKKDDVHYVSLRAVAMILDREENIVWDAVTKTITIAKE